MAAMYNLVSRSLSNIAKLFVNESSTMTNDVDDLN